MQNAATCPTAGIFIQMRCSDLSKEFKFNLSLGPIEVRSPSWPVIELSARWIEGALFPDARGSISRWLPSGLGLRQFQTSLIKNLIKHPIVWRTDDIEMDAVTPTQPPTV
jgi:hypothetical protein